MTRSAELKGKLIAAATSLALSALALFAAIAPAIPVAGGGTLA